MEQKGKSFEKVLKEEILKRKKVSEEKRGKVR